MHSFYLKKLPLSFAEMWQLNIERNPESALRNANDYFIPAHRVETVKDYLLFRYQPPGTLLPTTNLMLSNICI
jgi:hypothetical protein